MVGFYINIAMWSWFYVAQPELEVLLACGKTMAQEALEHMPKGKALSATAVGAVEHIVTHKL